MKADIMISKRKYIRGIIIAVLVTVALITAGSAIFLKYADVYGVIAQLSGQKSQTEKLEAILKSVLHGHIEELDEDALVDAAIKGMLSSIGDPYTYYLNSSEYDNLFSSKNPTYTGIGVTVDLNAYDDSVLVNEVYKGSGAFDAGIQVNDRIVAVNGLRCTAENKNEMLELAKGEEGTTVSVTILRDTKEIELTVERRTIRIELAVSTVYNDSIGYIRLRSFQAAAEEDFNKHLDELLAQNITGLIIDLRGNGGGYKDVAVNLVDHFIPKGTVYTSVNNEGVVDSDTSSGNMIDIPFVLLVDANSASASELFAGAVQDYGTGLLIGAKTFGKGIVQYTYRLSDGSYYQYTAETWLTPNGRYIHGIGLTPDIEVEMDEDIVSYIDSHPTLIPSTEYDKQLEAAIKALEGK